MKSKYCPELKYYWFLFIILKAKQIIKILFSKYFNLYYIECIFFFLILDYIMTFLII